VIAYTSKIKTELLPRIYFVQRIDRGAHISLRWMFLQFNYKIQDSSSIDGRARRLSSLNSKFLIFNVIFLLVCLPLFRHFAYIYILDMIKAILPIENDN